MSRLRPERLLVLPLVALVAVVVVSRGVRLWQEPHRLDAHEERTWLGWAYRGPDTAALFARIEAALAPGEPVALVVPRGGRNAEWYRFTALYYLPHANVVAVVERGSGKPLPPEATVVAVRWNGGFQIKQPAAARPAPNASRERSAGPAALACGALLALIVGLALLRPLPWLEPRWMLAPQILALALPAGLTLLVAIGFPLARLGAPVGPATIAGLALALSALLLFLRRRGAPIPPVGLPAEIPPPDLLSRLAGLLVALALGLFLAKLALAPVWTWDHLAVWGVKARRMVEGGRLDLSFLDRGIFWPAQPHYPLAVPAIWRLLGVGALPGDLAFKSAHGLFGLALVALTRYGALLLSRSRAVANGLAAWLAVSPVLWDTIALGHADIVLGLWALAALVLVIAAVPETPWRGSLALAGCLIGFLPWIKQEGTLVAPALLAAAALLVRLRAPAGGRLPRLAALALPAGFVFAGSRLVSHVAKVQGIRFFADDWWTRVADRLESPGPILSLALEALLAPDWLGFWIVLAAAVIAAVLLRRGTALVLCGLVCGLVAVYVAVYFATSLPPLDHLRGSLFRILCPLMPLGLLGIAALSVQSSYAPHADPRGSRGPRRDGTLLAELGARGSVPDRARRGLDAR